MFLLLVGNSFINLISFLLSLFGLSSVFSDVFGGFYKFIGGKLIIHNSYYFSFLSLVQVLYFWMCLGDFVLLLVGSFLFITLIISIFGLGSVFSGMFGRFYIFIIGGKLIMQNSYYLSSNFLSLSLSLVFSVELKGFNIFIICGE